VNPHGEIPEFRRRYRYLVAVVGLSFIVLAGRLCQLQVVKGETYLRLSENNFIQERRIPTVRGVVLDRQRRPLVTNRPSYDVQVTPRFATVKSVKRLVEELALPPDKARALRELVQGTEGRHRFNAQLVVRDISRDQLARIETHRSALAGFSVAARSHRNYLHGNLASHTQGYLNEVSARDLARDKNDTYHPGDLIGRAGVERMYEDQLRGVEGRVRIVVDAKGRQKRGAEAAALLRGQRRFEPRPGHNIVLTIDIEVQRLVERALRRHPSGAAVVLEVNTGRVLASASKPGFDPNVLTGRVSVKEYRRLTTNPYRPLIDKVHRENYFPGSTYKVIPAFAALGEGKLDPDEKIICKGWHNFGRRNFRCSHSHGKVNLHNAIVESCNVYFYTLAEQVGMDTIARYARLFGLGAPTGIGINGEVAGFIPTKAWYARRRQPFRIGFTLNAAIGQGNTKTTPIQIASLYATIANGGTLYLPQIVERIETSDGDTVLAFSPRVRRRIKIAPDALERVQRGLRGVVREEKGTGHASRLEELAVSGKTGTAQVSRRIKKGKTIWLADHSWFAAYAPSEKPEIAVAVLIEHGGRAAKVAAPVAMEIIRAYFRYVAPGRRAAASPVALPTGLAAEGSR
jgi:penicillin-binding protein 2